MSTNQEPFPRLHQKNLIQRAARWAEMFPDVKKISLHSYMGGVQYRYAMIFHMKFAKPPAELAKHDDGQDERMREIVWLEGEFKTDENYSDLFIDGKKDECGWHFWPRYQGEDLPKFAGQAHWMLYSDDSEDIQPKTKVSPKSRSSKYKDEVIKLANDYKLLNPETSFHEVVTILYGKFSKYQKKTIRKWIRPLFGKEGSRPGRPAKNFDQKPT